MYSERITVLLVVLFLTIATINGQDDRNSNSSARRLVFNPFGNFNNFNSGFNGLNNNNLNNFDNSNGNLNGFNGLFNNRYSQDVRYADCTTQLGTPGVCMSKKECGRSSGVSSGVCTIGTVCCSVALSCGGASTAKKVIMNNNIQTTTTTSSTCVYTINRFSQNVCQLRVDFTTNMPQPSGTPTAPANMPFCTGTYLQINNMVFCGVNSNQHVYIPFSAPTSSFQITAVVGSTGTAGATVSASWQISVTQLECSPSNKTSTTSTINADTNLFSTPGQLLDFNKLLKKRKFDDDLIAPNGCLQYYPATSGTFESFNYNNGAGPYMPNMQYAICFNRQSYSTGIQFSPVTFSMSFNEETMLDSACYDPITPTSSNDYLMIPNSMITQDGTFGTHYCGVILAGQLVVANPPGPFVVYVNTKDIYRAADQPLDVAGNTRAFRINYSLI